MNFDNLIDLYNQDKIGLPKLLLMIGREVGQDLSYSACYWFCQDIKRKNSIIKPITFAHINDKYIFFNGENCLFTINRIPYDKYNTNNSLLRTSIFPNIDDNEYFYDIYNNNYKLGLNGLYKYEDLSFNKYKYTTFTDNNDIYYDAYVNKDNGNIIKIFYDKNGYPKSKYFYYLKKNNDNKIDIYDAYNRIEKILCEEYPNLSSSLYKVIFSDLVDQYYYDINITDIKEKYKDLYVTKGTKFFIPSNDINTVNGYAIASHTDKNVEEFLALSHPTVSNFKLLCVTDFVNGYKLNKSLHKYITLELENWFYDLENNCLNDNEYLLYTLGDKILEINKVIYDEVKYYLVSKNKKDGDKKQKEKVLGSALALSLITPSNTYFFNYGDTRIYAVLDNVLSRLTLDDTKVWDYYKKGYYNYEEACNYQKKSMLTNYVGNPNSYFKLPELYSINNDNYDKLFILSDGITDNLEEFTISDIIRLNDGSEALNMLVNQAFKSQRRSDNVTGCCYIKNRRKKDRN